MGRLNSTIHQREKAVQKKNMPIDLPVYNADGSVRKKARKSTKALIAFCVCICIIAGAIYIPALTMKEITANEFYTTPNPAGIKNVNDYTLSHPDEDFDLDGLTNAEEANYNTSPRKADTDGDGTTDFAELFITETSPIKADNSMAKIVEKKDAEEGNSVNTPYKIHDVVMWPDDMSSRVYGGLVRTHNGYRFCNFTGWAQFPTGKFAYKIKDGIHVPLEYKEIENAWEIEDDCEIILYDEPQEMVHQLTIAGLGTYYLEDNILGKVLSFILPDKSTFISCKRVSRADTWIDTNKMVTAPIKAVEYDESNMDRYGKTHTMLTDLANVYYSIDSGCSVLASLNSSEAGEIIAIIYGYDSYGNLLVADYNTLEPVGTIEIEERAGRQLDKNGELVQAEWYEFKGCGFDSKLNFDRINYFAAATTDKDNPIVKNANDTSDKNVKEANNQDIMAEPSKAPVAPSQALVATNPGDTTEPSTEPSMAPEESNDIAPEVTQPVELPIETAQP